jgi:hypothetical protein
MAPPLLGAGVEDDPSTSGAEVEPETSFLEPEMSYLEPDPPTFRGDALVVEAAPADQPPVEEAPTAPEPAPSMAAAVGAAPAIPMSGLPGPGYAQIEAGRQHSKLERRLAELAPEHAVVAAPEPAIGAPNVELFDCPACGRPLARGTSTCTTCGTRLIGGRPMRRVATFAGIGVVAVLVLGAVGMTAFAMSSTPPRTGGVPTSSASASRPGATAAAPSEGPTNPTGVPAAAAAALSGTGVINARITTDAGKLAVTLSDAKAPTVDVARAMRALAADAQQGLDMSARLAPWTDAAPVVAKLDAFYRGLTETAREALRVSLNDATAYRRAGVDLIAKVRGLADVDAASRQLAAGAGISLPPLVDPGGASSAPSP